MNISNLPSGNTALDQLARIDIEMESARLARRLRIVRHPELEGLGTAYQFSNAVHAANGRATHMPDDQIPTVQRVALHGASKADADANAHRATTPETRRQLSADDILARIGCTAPARQTVQPLLDKKTENNGCTPGSQNPSATLVATPDNSFASPPPARAALQENEACTAPVPPSSVQEGNGQADADGDGDAGGPLLKVALGYCRCDFFDNGVPAQKSSARKRRSRARFKVNAHLGVSAKNFAKFSIAFLSQPRFFKRSAPAGHDAFYENVFGAFADMRLAVKADGMDMAIPVAIAHLKDANNHVVPKAAALLWQETGAPVEIALFLGGSVFNLSLNHIPKGAAKCPALKWFGYWKPGK
ncbi:hypothetical protein [Sphingomonas sp.]|uniref:hypothetical protein n=1 Tax=Sphingomonas sp. TaxID=28214 RepID=UPI002ED9B162